MRYFLFVFNVIKSCILIILHFIDIQIDETEINANQMEVTVPTIELLEQSKIYHSETLNPYQSAINKAAYEICSENPMLMKQKGILLEAARKKVNADGYQYAKKSSRSKVFGTSAQAGSNAPTAKKCRLSTEIRSNRIQECQEDLKNIELQLKFAERAQEKFANIHQYQSAIGALKEIKEMKEKRRDILTELGSLQKKEAKSLCYKNKRSHKQQSFTQDTTASNGTIDSYFRDTSTPSNGSDTSNADESSVENSEADNPPFLEI
jgi:hypothetical protein